MYVSLSYCLSLSKKLLFWSCCGQFQRGKADYSYIGLMEMEMEMSDVYHVNDHPLTNSMVVIRLSWYEVWCMWNSICIHYANLFSFVGSPGDCAAICYKFSFTQKSKMVVQFTIQEAVTFEGKLLLAPSSTQTGVDRQTIRQSCEVYRHIWTATSCEFGDIQGTRHVWRIFLNVTDAEHYV